MLSSLVLVALTVTGTIQAAPFGVSSQSAIYDPATGLVTFQITFTAPPNLFVVDDFGRAENDFQYYIIGDPSEPYPILYDTIIRGGEIYLGAGLPIRSASPPSDDPTSGGWGSVRATVPFTLIGADLTFSVPLTTISDHSTGGHFSYLLQTDVFGAETQETDGRSSIGPPPLCQLTSVITGPPKQLVVTMQAVFGIGSLVTTESVNTSVAFPPFTVGTTGPVNVIATKMNQSLSSTVAFLVTDEKGNTTACDPTDFTISLENDGEKHVFRSISNTEHYIRITNGSPGVRNLEFMVNETPFEIRGLLDHETSYLDIGTAVRSNAPNLIVLYANGVPGDAATVVIGDASCPLSGPAQNVTHIPESKPGSLLEHHARNSSGPP